MGIQLLLMFPLVGAAALDGDRFENELTDLLASVAQITKDRWDVAFDVETNRLTLIGKRQIRCRVLSYSFSGSVATHQIRFRFKVIPQFDESNLQRISAKLQTDLTALRERAKSIPQRTMKATTEYNPRTREEWRQVLRIRRAENDLENIPEYAFGQIYLSEEYNMRFRPVEGDPLGNAMRRDIDEVYRLFRRLPVDAPALPPALQE